MIAFRLNAGGVILADLASAADQAPHGRPAGHNHPPGVHALGVAVTATAQERSHASPATAIAITRCDGRDSTGVRYPAFGAAAPVVVSINSATQNGQIRAAPPAQIRQLTLPHLPMSGSCKTIQLYIHMYLVYTHMYLAKAAKRTVLKRYRGRRSQLRTRFSSHLLPHSLRLAAATMAENKRTRSAPKVQ